MCGTYVCTYVSIRDLCVCPARVHGEDTYVYHCMGYMYVSIRDPCVCVCVCVHHVFSEDTYTIDTVMLVKTSYTHA